MAAIDGAPNLAMPCCDIDGDNIRCCDMAAAATEWPSGTAPGGIVLKNGDSVDEAAADDMNSIVDEAGGARGTTGTVTGEG